jgi:hypothetical protein
MLRRNNPRGTAAAKGKQPTSSESTGEEVVEPARVYPSPDAPGRWVVEAPKTPRAADPRPVLFNGPEARQQALRYAYEVFGGARFFPF